MPLEFAKMHGLGNDFIVLPHFDASPWQYERLARKWCDRHTGIGADGLILAGPSEKADCSMRIFNSDGSEAMMCGNGLRCLAHYARTRGIVTQDSFSVETRAGLRHPEILSLDGPHCTVSVDMGVPRATRGDIPMGGPHDESSIDVPLTAGGYDFKATGVSMGNPHCVIFVDSLEEIDLARLGPLLERHPLFPDRTNVEFVEVRGQALLAVKVWERGAGVTMACGTGACACVVASALTGRTGRRVEVALPGGSLDVWYVDDDRVFMTGPSVRVFEGSIAFTGKENS